MVSSEEGHDMDSSQPDPETVRKAGVLSNMWRLVPDASAVVIGAVPHRVVSQILRPEVAAFLPPLCVALRSLGDAQRCVTELQIANKTTPVQNEDIQFAVQLPLLTSVDLMGSRLVSADFGRLCARLSHLRRLRLSKCRALDSRALVHVATIPQLEHLDISQCYDIGNDTMSCLMDLPLRHLDISWRDIHMRCLEAIAALSQLRSLNLSYSSINARGLAYVAKLPLLECLVMIGCRDVDADGLMHVGTMTTLQRLELSCCHSVDAKGLAYVARLPHLRFLDISDCEGVDDAARACVRHVPQ